MGINKRDFGKGVIYGYGILLNNLNCGNVISFITKHRDIVQSLYPESEMDDMLGCLYRANKIGSDDYDMIIFDHGMDYFPYIVGLVLNVELGTTGFLGMVGEEGFDDCLLWQPEYPWEMTDDDKLIDQARIDEIYKNIMNELGIHGKPFEMSLFYDDFPKNIAY
ncbi:hypothetical protein [Oribacterium sp. WCC10]|uniref:hypothetical protein n=1 Tax=Oribacterium sp. WCC10 TaxID=1855343 RepID=UPI0008EEA9F4|nr:hypothetical protein [Oribacterium sp. WCC10]SFG74949.1 hypothetical protein SAMN05216356_1247 [Oribacterium sp. WCC10]